MYYESLTFVNNIITICIETAEFKQWDYDILGINKCNCNANRKFKYSLLRIILEDISIFA